MWKRRKVDLLVDDHNKMVENLNKISDDLLKAKWNFLASISAIGLAYKYVLDKYIWDLHKEYLFFVICLIGNLIFWMLSEYAISHGFLFRYIQAKAAKIEKEAYTEEEFQIAIKSVLDLSQ